MDLNNKPDDLIEKYSQAKNSYGSAKVPLLEHDGNLIAESDNVVRYIAESVDKRADGLLPPDAEDIIDSFLFNWNSVVDNYYDILTARSEKGAQSTLAQFESSLTDLENDFPEGDFVCGDNFSIVECMTAPWVQRFFVTLPYYRAIDFERSILPKFPKVSKWMSGVRSRPSVVQSECPHDEMLAAATRYYVSYLSPNSKSSLGKY